MLIFKNNNDYKYDTANFLRKTFRLPVLNSRDSVAALPAFVLHSQLRPITSRSLRAWRRALHSRQFEFGASTVAVKPRARSIASQRPGGRIRSFARIIYFFVCFGAVEELDFSGQGKKLSVCTQQVNIY